MRKGWKIFWVVCVLTAGVGLGMFIVGVGMGATPSAIRQAYREEGSRWENGIRFIEDFDSGAGSNDQYVREFTNIRELDIEVAYAELEIKSGQGSTIIVDTSQLERRLRDDLVIEAEESELKFERRSSSLWDIVGKNNAGRIVMTIPQDAKFEKASFDVGAGLLTIGDISASSLDVNVGAGKSVVNKFQADELGVECGAGQMVLSGSVNRDVKIESGAGEVKLQLTGLQSDYNYELEANIGRVRVGKDSYTGISNERIIDNRAGKKMEISSNVGNVEVAFSNN